MKTSVGASAPKSVRELIRELSGTACRCGAKKRKKQTFCSRCYYALPKPMAAALYRLVGEGYESAYANASRWLDAHQGGAR